MLLSEIASMKVVAPASILPVLFFCQVLYNLFLHPLAKYPGPWVFRASPLPYMYYQVRGLLPHVLKEIHEKYGPTVRIAPNSLSFTQSQAWFDIHDHRSMNRVKRFERDPSVYPEVPGRAPSIFLSNESDHTRYRKLLSHAFSAQALREQEPILQSHIELLIQRLHEEIDGPKHGKVDMTMWLNYCAFDIVGDLSFGESFGCLENKRSHPWVDIIFSAIRGMTYMAALSYLPKFIFVKIVTWTEQYMFKDVENGLDYTIEKVHKRIAQGTTRNDFMSPVLKVNDEKGMSIEEIESSLNVIVQAGSETTSTTISTVLYHLAQHPHIMKKTIDELTSTLKTPSQASVQTIENLPFLYAVIHEALRIHPPTPYSHARIVPPGGANVCGEFLPAGTAVGVATYATSLSQSNWTDPEEFKPERWLGEGFQGDDRRSSQPFLLGSRLCIGKHLAYAEMRLALSYLLLNFEWNLCDESRDWTCKQPCYMTWDRPPLYFRITRKAMD